MYNSNDIADWILSQFDLEAGDTISPLKLQKLLYYCQAWHLTIFKKPIFSDKIEAWAHGPVVPRIYFRFARSMRLDNIDIRNTTINIPDLPNESKELLLEVIGLYGEKSGRYLENLTHSENPWKQARVGLEPHARSNNEITHQSMIDYYSQYKKDE